MTRKLLVPAIFALLTQFVFGQTYFNFPDTNTTWRYLRCDITNLNPNGYQDCYTQTFSITGDTIINAKTYHTIDAGGYYAAIREDTLGRVYIVHPMETTEYLKFNFNGTVGDTMQVNPVKVISIKDSVLVNGNYRDRFILTNNDTVVEGIGTLNEVIGFYIIIDGVGFDLLCMTQNDTLVYQNAKYQTCDTSYSGPLGIPQQDNSIVLDISPNPFNDFTTIDIQGVEDKWTWILYNPLGQIVQRKDNVSNKHLTIKKEDLTAGVYIYQIRTSDKKAVVGKLIIE